MLVVNRRVANLGVCRKFNKDAFADALKANRHHKVAFYPHNLRRGSASPLLVS
jgi:hypothetical protein